MRTRKALAPLLLLLLLTGCGPARSLHPLFTEKEVVFEPGLLGQWVSNDGTDGEATYIFKKSGENAYTLTLCVEKPFPRLLQTFDVRLVRLGRFLFLDAQFRDFVLDEEALGTSVYAVRAHLFGRIGIEGDTVRIRLLDADWLKKAVADKKVKISYEELDSSPVLTASTTELQQFVLRYAEDKDAFSAGEISLHRRGWKRFGL